MPKIPHFDISLESVTPLWLGGVNYRPELRAPSFRGCLRYWLRALLGGGLGDDFAALARAESAVFGSVRRSTAIVVRTIGDVQTGLPALDSSQYIGMEYMYWSMFQRGRKAILPEQSFCLRLQLRPLLFETVDVNGRSITPLDASELALASLWLLVRLGGVGARTRRCAGVLRALSDPAGWPSSLPPLTSSATTPAELAQEIGDGVKMLRGRIGWPEITLPKVSPYDILHSDASDFYVSDRTFPNWWEAVNWMGEAFQQFRRAQKDDARGVAGLLTKGRFAAQTIGRAAFGLPIVFFFKSMFSERKSRGAHSGEARRKASATVGPRRGMARMSPLLFRVVRLNTDPAQYVGLMGVFRSQLTPDDQLSVKGQDRSIRPATVRAPDYRLVDKWFDCVRNEHQTALLPVSLG